MSVTRDVARALRRVPVVRGVLEAGDPQRRAARLAQSGLIDPVFYGQLYDLGEPTAETAALHYAKIGYHEHATINPLIEPDVLDRHLMISGRPIIYDYVNSRAWHVQASGWWDAPAYLETHPDAADHPSGPAGHLWQRLRSGDATGLTVNGTALTHKGWEALYAALSRASRQWREFDADNAARRLDADLRHPATLPHRFPDDRARPLVSVILPVWNRPAGLRTAVASLQAQTWQNWELIVVDDGSWDDTLALLDIVESLDPRVRVLRRSHNGVCAARNAGLAAAAGDYVAFLDSDNTWLPRFLEDMMTALEQSPADAGYATVRSISEDGIAYRQNQTDYRRLLSGNTIDMNTLVVRREALTKVGGFDESLRRAVDYDLILRLARVGTLVHIPTVGANYDNTDSAEDRISTSEPLGWNIHVRLRQLVDGTYPEPTVGGSCIVCLQSGDPELAAKLGAAREITLEGTQVVLAMIDPRSDEWRHAIAATYDLPSASAVLFGHEPFSFVIDVALARVLHDRTVVVGPTTSFTAADVRALAEAVDPAVHRAVMPLATAEDGTLIGVGSARAREGQPPFRPLAGHPQEDALVLNSRHRVPALTGRTFALPTADLRAVGGLDPLLYNEFETEGLSYRLRKAHRDYEFDLLTDLAMWEPLPVPVDQRVDAPGNLLVIRELGRDLPADDASAIYRRLGQELASLGPGGEVPVDASERAPGSHLVARPVRLRETIGTTDASAPRLRWAIKTASPAGPVGESWGDTHFARSLAAALRRLGQEVVVDALPAHDRASGALDDVVIALRGLDAYSPLPGQLSFLWVISHPDMVTRSEAARFDRVFAASLHWAAQTTERWGIPVEALLQCTDPTLFAPTGAARGDEILFVGNSRGVPRPTVMESVRGELDVKVYGGDWERFIPPERITGTGIPNGELAQHYERASVVLNDHWSDMKREGFISNRLFDVVAAGGRVLSDDVAGIDEIFSGAVRTYRTVSQIVPELTADPSSLFPSESVIAEVGTRIRAEHSFDARAEVLLARAIDALGIAPRS